MRKLLFVIASTLPLVACSSATDTPTVEDTPGNAVLGVERFEIDESSHQLRVTGFDAEHQVVAKLTLRLEDVIVPEVNEVPLPGRIIDIELRGAAVEGHMSVGRNPLHLPPHDNPEVTELMRDPVVAAALARWNVVHRKFAEFGGGDAPVIADESSYNQCVANGCNDTSCRSGRFTPPCSAGGGYHLSETTDPWIYNINGNSYHAYGQALVCANGSRHWRACTKANADTGCGTAGSQGCVSCWGGQEAPAGTYGFASCPVGNSFDPGYCGDGYCASDESVGSCGDC